MYEVLRTLARSHQSVVDLARAEDGRLVALKRIHIDGNDTERATARRRIRREAEVLASVEVSGVIELLDVYDDEGETVIVTPYLPGGSLADRVVRDGPVDTDELGRIAVPLLTALAAVHRRGIVHRDVKPSNILFDDDGRAVLADFGISSTRDFTPGLTANGLVVGTPAYLAPERARGEDAVPAGDVYSLGASLRFAVSGMPPHGIGDLTSILTRAATARVEPLPPHLDERVAAALDAMCRLDPADRPSAAELVDGPDGTIRFVPPAPHESHGGDATAAVRPVRTVGRVARVAALGVVLVLAGAGMGLLAGDWMGSRGQPAAAADDFAERVEELLADDESTTTTAPEPTTTTTVPCEPLPYQGCDDAEPAPNTDGEQCLDGWFDHDGNATTGCEAQADDIDDTVLTDRMGFVEGTIIPVGDVDKVLVPVVDRWSLFCNDVLTLTLTAPSGLDLEMTVFDGGRQIGQVETGMGDVGRLRLQEPSCGGDDSTTLEVVIRGIEGRSSDVWRLERSGSW
ncbi:MAG: serine/threonine-protein kinase [Acidimicrobiales bacterium]